MLTVNEIFHSIQGESDQAGRPCVFVRLTACDLRCVWCDTPYAFHEGHKLEVEQVVAQVAAYGCDLVEITGGEPLLQEEVYDLMERLLASGVTVMLETGGHLSVTRVPAAVVKVMDVKCPGSGECDRNLWDNLSSLTARDQTKFVIADRADYEFAREVTLRHGLDQRCAAVLFSPVHGVLPPVTLAEWVLADRLAVRVQVQLHKYLWAPDARGV
ncbi:MAG TPA: radical SAM protein [Acidobacteria bacterium]|jgi:7-carboxy-7-deazaguanine synthase|nr:radical SAM protein [Acidobacteriota bacterium]